MRWFSRLTATCSGLLVGMLLTELLFAARDRFSFPHLNLYLPDEDLGVRLMPSSRERISFGGNPVSTVHVNQLGYRGDDWPSPPPQGEILVVGDSQVFGLGVDDHETHPARLAAHTGRPVLNGGVPTYGPREYLAAAEEILEARDGIETLVVVFNFSNDLFEIDRPNRERHAVWDGWAVRIETAPEQTIWFPGRDLLYRKSHAFFALRKAWHLLNHSGLPSGLPSEGVPLDVVFSASAQAKALHEDIDSKVELARKDARKRYEVGVDSLGDEQTMRFLFGEISGNYEEVVAIEAHASEKQPGDIVANPYLEGSRPVEVTADMLLRGAELRAALPERLMRWAQENPDEYYAERILGLLRMGGTLDPALAGEHIEGLPFLGSPLDSALDEAALLAEAHGVELVVVALPLDVQVSEGQWAKYGLPPRDLSATRVLLEDVGLSCARRQIRFLNALPALAELGEEAFLLADLHLTPAGQDRLAAAIAETISAPPALPPPNPGLPEGRGRIPSWFEWSKTEATSLRGSHGRCEWRKIREWLKVNCNGETPKAPLPRVGRVEGPLEIFASRPPESFDLAHLQTELYVPLFQGRETSIELLDSKLEGTLTVTWEKGRPVITLVRGTPARGRLLPETMRAGPIAPGLGETLFYGSGPADCAASFSSQPDFTGCVYGGRAHMPSCPPGMANAGSAGHCFALCSTALPCSAGVCTPWMGSAVCL